MQNMGFPSSFGLENHGLSNIHTAYWNLFPPALVEQIILRREGDLANLGAVVVNTGQHTGRSPNDKYVVRNNNQADDEIWWGKINQPISPQKFERIFIKMAAYLQKRDVFIQDMQAGAYPDHHLKIRIISDKAWSSLFARDLFIRLPHERLFTHVPEFTVIQCPEFLADPVEDGTNSSTFIVLNFERKLVLIGGTAYAGEIKKSIFSVMNYLLPRKGVLSMHCSANLGPQSDVALFFGLSGTGKTTLSSDPDRRLIGDDEHGWGENGIFNFEGGCYAKTIHLRPNLEPLIWEATRKFGTVLENVVFDPETRQVDFDSDSLTENTRAAYPIDFVPNHVTEGYAGHPDNIFFLSADAFGVLPPIARLTPDQAMYYFLSGYTSKLAGTEKGIGSEPQATFSTCFGSPFLPLFPRVYSGLLGEKIARYQSKVWLVNTGWTGGPYGVGERIKLPYTRAMIRAALLGQLEKVTHRKDRHFGLMIPQHCPGVPDEVLDPELTWPDKAAYHIQAINLVSRFEKNFAQFENYVPPELVLAGPHIENLE
jgi:phosphoenolpyruvate carboxykinase (ATP)